jgi:hypothetical protein
MIQEPGPPRRTALEGALKMLRRWGVVNEDYRRPFEAGHWDEIVRE